MSKIRCLFLVVVLFPIQILLAQTNKPIRIEIPWNSSAEPFVVAPCAENGLVLFYATNQYPDKNHAVWVFNLYDKNLQKVWTKEYPVIKNFNYQQSDFKDGILNLCFLKDGKSADDNNFEILRITLYPQNFEEFLGKTPDKDEILQFKVFNNMAFIGLAAGKNENSLFTFNFQLNKMDTISIDNQSETRIEKINFDSVTRQINILVKQTEKRKQKTYYNTYNLSGKLQHTLFLNPKNEDVIINSAEMFSTNANSKLIIGTFSTKSVRNSSVDLEGSEQSSGFFTYTVTGSTIDTGNFIRFTSLQNFYTYSNSEDYLKMKKKAEKMAKSGKEYDYAYNLLVHDIVNRNGKYILVVEAFHPEYHTEQSFVYNYYGQPFNNTVTVFDGYRYSNAIVLAFDSTGNQSWDNGMELWNILAKDIKKRVNVSFDGEEIVLAYSSEGKIAYKIIKEKETVDEISYSTIDTNFNNDELTSDTGNGLELWYKNYFIAYGYQSVRNNSMVDNKRAVFYINKIAFQ